VAVEKTLAGRAGRPRVSWREARRALKASGVRWRSLIGLAWPLGRGKRALALVRDRRAVLETKNLVVDYLFRAQRALATMGLRTTEQLLKALQDPSKRPTIMSAAVNRGMMEEVLASRHGLEGGRTLDRALSELLSAGVVLKASARPASNQDVYIAVQGRERPHYDLSALSRLLQAGSEYGQELRERARRDEATQTGRVHRL